MVVGGAVVVGAAVVVVVDDASVVDDALIVVVVDGALVVSGLGVVGVLSVRAGFAAPGVGTTGVDPGAAATSGFVSADRPSLADWAATASCDGDDEDGPVPAPMALDEAALAPA